MNVLNYEQAAAYIEEIPKFTRKHPLKHTQEFIRRLGNPSSDRQVIHVAGTNGKGSVCAYLQAILLAEGHQTGFFTSPHLVCVNERIRINGVPLSDDTFLRVFSYVQPIAAQMKADGLEHPSYFEFLYGMGMIAFAQSEAVYIILETGLGGRLDATNSFTHPIATAITSISLDHTDILGDTIEEIAYEKAGIIKEEVPVFFDGTNEKVTAIIKEIAYKRGATCREISKNAFEIQEVHRKAIAFSRANAYDEYGTWHLSQGGLYQVMNAEIALEVAEYVLRDQKIHTEYWKTALRSVCWEGRMEEVVPHLTIDGAHNLGAIEAFADSLEACPKEGRDSPVIVFSAVLDKQYEAMIACLCRRIRAKVFIVTEIEDGRKVSAEVLRQIFREYTDTQILCEPVLEQAIELAFQMREEEEIFCLGSLYLVGMIKKLFGGRQ